MKTRTHLSHANRKGREFLQSPCRRRNPTWGLRAFYSRSTAETRRDWRRFRMTLRPGLERNTQAVRG